MQRAVMDGRSVSGVSIMVLTEGMDEGPLLATTEEPIRDDDTAGSLGDRLAAIGSGRLVDAFGGLRCGRPHSRSSRITTRATYAPKVTTEEAAIDWLGLPRRSATRCEA